MLWFRGAGSWTTTTESVDGSYHPIVGNFDGQLGDDVFWYYRPSGYVNEWYSAGTRNLGSTRNRVTVGDGLEYTPIVGDFDGSGTKDIFWYRAGSTQDLLWYSSVGSQTPVARNAVNVDGDYLPLAGNFNRRTESLNGVAAADDIMWDAVDRTTDYVWTGIAGNQTSQFDRSAKAQNVYGSFVPVVGDFDGDGNTDVFWYRN